MKTFVQMLASVVLASVVLAATPANATEKLPKPTYTGKYDAKTGRYCLSPREGSSEAMRTGTRIQRVECKTQAEWAAEGLQVALK